MSEDEDTTAQAIGKLREEPEMLQLWRRLLSARELLLQRAGDWHEFHSRQLARRIADASRDPHAARSEAMLEAHVSRILNRVREVDAIIQRLSKWDSKDRGVNMSRLRGLVELMEGETDARNDAIGWIVLWLAEKYEHGQHVELTCQTVETLLESMCGRRPDLEELERLAREQAGDGREGRKDTARRMLEAAERSAG